MSLQQQLEESRQRLRDLRAEEQQIREESTAFRMEKNAREQREAIVEAQALERQVNDAIAAEGPTPREVELTTMLKESIHNEQALVRRLGLPLPEKFIRADAVVHFRAERDKAQNRIDEIHRTAQSQQVSLGQRSREELAECEARINGWKKIQSLCEMGERVWRERQDRQALVDEKNQLEAERKQRVMAL
jgi:hypothetical protein